MVIEIYQQLPCAILHKNITEVGYKSCVWALAFLISLKYFSEYYNNGTANWNLVVK